MYFFRKHKTIKTERRLGKAVWGGYKKSLRKAALVGLGVKDLWKKLGRVDIKDCWEKLGVRYQS